MGEIYWDMANVLVQPYGKEWSIRRKLLHRALTPAALQLYKPIQTAEASRLCFQLLSDPQSWEGLVDRFTSSIVFSISYGHRIDSLDAKVIRQRLAFMHYSASLNVPGTYLAETFPLLKHIPNFLAPWKREVQTRGKQEAAVNMSLVHEVEQDLVRAKESSQQIPDSLTKQLLQIRNEEGIPLSDRDFSFVPASLFGAGSDTTASTICSAFLALITHPSALHSAHAELDSIIGPDRTPTFDDEPHLPYTRALVKEVLRWRPVAVLGGTPHASTEHDIYQGYHIPAGTTVLGNNWAINLNEEYYPDPHRFDPARFLPLSSLPPTVTDIPLKGSKSHPSKSGHSSFGWGRRICPGADLAANSLFIGLSKLLWAYDILPIEGTRYDIFDYTDGFNSRPRSFECTVRVRNERHKEVLEREMKGAEQVMAAYTCFKE
ncbi:hypothetical protein MMC20_007408 [Loxospora ochrophaea]|nr:hypothetical protein [Loxospora ochrophaea]